MAAGEIKADDQQNIVLDFPAAIESIYVKNGARVSKGDQIVALNMQDYFDQLSDLENKLDQSKLQLEMYKTNLAAANSQAALAKSQYTNLSSDTSSVDLQQSAYDYEKELLARAEDNLSDQQMLFDASIISQKELEAAENKVADLSRAVDDKLRALSAAQTSRNQSLNSLSASMVQTRSQADQLNLTIAMQEKSIESLEDDLDRYRAYYEKPYFKDQSIICSFDHGLVQSFTGETGDYLPAKHFLMKLVDMDSLKVDAYVLEDFIKDVHVGSPAEIHLISNDTLVYSGHVETVSSVGEDINNETMFYIEVSIDTPDESIRLNDNVDVYILPDSQVSN